MTYKLGKRSIERLTGVDPKLVAVVNSAIGRSKQDFSVICGLRTREQQEKLVKSGASQTMKSKHLDGLAVDLMAWDSNAEPQGRWELNLYDEIADAMASAARDCGVDICWGAAWATESMPLPMNIRHWNGSMEDAMNAYVDLRRSQNRRPFLDGPHFQLIGG